MDLERHPLRSKQGLGAIAVTGWDPHPQWTDQPWNSARLKFSHGRSRSSWDPSRPKPTTKT